MAPFLQRPLFVLALFLFVCGGMQSQENPPMQPFQAVHLLWVDTQQPNAEETVLAAMDTLNKAIVQAGCASCVYHLWKVTDAAPGSYNYVQSSEWPNGTVYTRVHTSPAYLAASRNWAALRSVITREAYNRYVEVGSSGGEQQLTRR